VKTLDELQEILEQETIDTNKKYLKNFTDNERLFEEKILHGLRNIEKWISLGQFALQEAEFIKDKLQELNYNCEVKSIGENKVYSNFYVKVMLR
jgi:hypothetical protein